MTQLRYDRRKARRRRVELGLSTVDLAHRTAIPVWSIYSYERDNNPVTPPPRRLQAIAAALALDPEDLLLDDPTHPADEASGGAA